MTRIQFSNLIDGHVAASKISKGELCVVILSTKFDQWLHPKKLVLKLFEWPTIKLMTLVVFTHVPSVWSPLGLFGTCPSVLIGEVFL